MSPACYFRNVGHLNLPDVMPTLKAVHFLPRPFAIEPAVTSSRQRASSVLSLSVALMLPVSIVFWRDVDAHMALSLDIAAPLASSRPTARCHRGDVELVGLTVRPAKARRRWAWPGPRPRPARRQAGADGHWGRAASDREGPHRPRKAAEGDEALSSSLSKEKRRELQ